MAFSSLLKSMEHEGKLLWLSLVLCMSAPKQYCSDCKVQVNFVPSRFSAGILRENQSRRFFIFLFKGLLRHTGTSWVSNMICISSFKIMRYVVGQLWVSCVLLGYMKCCFHILNYCRNLKFIVVKCVFLCFFFDWITSWATRALLLGQMWPASCQLNRPGPRQLNEINK